MKHIIYVVLLTVIFACASAQTQKVDVHTPIQQYLLYKLMGLEFSLPLIAAPDDTDLTKLINENIEYEYKNSIRSDNFPPYEKLLKPYFQKISGQLLANRGL